MISLAGVAIFMFGNKLEDQRNLVLADGVQREFQIAIQHGLVPIPIGATGYVAEELWNKVLATPSVYYAGMEDWIVPIIRELGDKTLESDELVNSVINIIKQLNK